MRTPLADLAKSISWANKANAVLLCGTGAIGFFSALMHPTVDLFSSVLVAIYVGVLGAMLLRYEFSAGTELLRDFGFMYTYAGRCGFLLLVANLAWTCAPLGFFAAVLTNANALLSAFIMWRHPSFVSGHASATAIGGIGGGDGSELMMEGTAGMHRASSASSFDPASDAARARAAAGGL